MSRAWTPDDVWDFCASHVVTDLVTACEMLGLASRTKAYELYRRGELPFPVVKAGTRLTVPTVPLLKLLHLAPDDPESSDTDESQTPSHLRSVG